MKKLVLVYGLILPLASCGAAETVDRSFDCVDIWNLGNCIIFDKSNKTAKPRGGIHVEGGKITGAPASGQYRRAPYNGSANSVDKPVTYRTLNGTQIVGSATFDRPATKE